MTGHESLRAARPSWRERIEKAAQMFEEWHVLPLEPRLDKAMKAAGFRDVIEENAQLRLTIRAINDNALAWHVGEDGKASALNVIAVWTAEALAGRLHPSVEAITEALDDAR